MNDSGKASAIKQRCYLTFILPYHELVLTLTSHSLPDPFKLNIAIYYLGRQNDELVHMLVIRNIFPCPSLFSLDIYMPSYNHITYISPHYSIIRSFSTSTRKHIYLIYYFLSVWLYSALYPVSILWQSPCNIPQRNLSSFKLFSSSFISRKYSLTLSYVNIENPENHTFNFALLTSPARTHRCYIILMLHIKSRKWDKLMKTI